MSALPGMKRRQGVLARFVGDRLDSGALRRDSFLGRAAIWAVSAPIRWKRHRILFRDGYYRLSDLPPALGFIPGPARRELAGKPRPILLSALGLGEMLNVLPLLRRLQELHSRPIVVLSRNPAQASRLARAEGLSIIALPYLLTDFPPLVSCWLKGVRPALILAMETLDELRAGMLGRAKGACGASLALLNHDVPPDIGQDWRRMEAEQECRRTLPLVDAAGVVTERAAAGLVSRGLPPERIERMPNLKFDTARRAASRVDPAAERKRLGLKPDVPVLVFGSVHPKEQELLLDAYRKVLDRPGLAGTRLILAPRYLRTVGRILDALPRYGLSGVRLTRAADPADPPDSVIVVDTAGDLRRLYSVADVALVGGSLDPRLGGHNPIEPAAFGTATIMGPYAPAFADILSRFLSGDAILQLARPGDAAETLIALLEDPAARGRLGRNARRIVSEQCGAEDRCLGMIAALGM